MWADAPGGNATPSELPTLEWPLVLSMWLEACLCLKRGDSSYRALLAGHPKAAATCPAEHQDWLWRSMSIWKLRMHHLITLGSMVQGFQRRHAGVHCDHHLGGCSREGAAAQN